MSKHNRNLQKHLHTSDNNPFTSIYHAFLPKRINIHAFCFFTRRCIFKFPHCLNTDCYTSTGNPVILICYAIRWSEYFPCTLTRTDPSLPLSSQVESFILDQEDLDNPIMKTASELLLSSATDGVDLRTVDPETQARLEALLEAAGTTNPSPNGIVFVHRT